MCNCSPIKLSNGDVCHDINCSSNEELFEPVIGTMHHKKCMMCGNYTVDPEDNTCKNAYCSDDMHGEREFMKAKGNLSEDERIIYGL